MHGTQAVSMARIDVENVQLGSALPGPLQASKKLTSPGHAGTIVSNIFAVSIVQWLLEIKRNDSDSRIIHDKGYTITLISVCNTQDCSSIQKKKTWWVCTSVL